VLSLVLLTDGLIYLSVLFFSSFFTTLTFVLPYSVEGEVDRVMSIAPMAIRALVFPLFSGLGWFILGSYSITANNCSLIFNACYTSPTYTTTTSTISFSGFTGLGYLYMGFASIMFIVTAIMGIMMYYNIMKMTVGRKARILEGE
jgi:hypothetical protein